MAPRVGAASLTASFADRQHAIRPGLGDVFIFLRRVAADTNSANDFAAEDDWDAALQRDRAGKRQGGNATVLYLIFKHSAGTTKDGRRSRFRDSHIYACDLRIIEALQYEQVATVINNRDYDGRAASLSLGFCGSRDLVRGLESQDLLSRKLRLHGGLCVGEN